MRISRSPATSRIRTSRRRSRYSPAMMFIGRDFRAGLREALYRPFNPAGLVAAICIFLALFIVNQVVLQPAFAIGIGAAMSGLASINADFQRGAVSSILPAGLLTAWLAWLLAHRHGAD